MKTLIAILIIIMASLAYPQDFVQEQQKYPRVRKAQINTEQIRDSLFKAAGMEYPPAQIFLRAFKHERLLELWAADSVGAQFTLIKTYPFTAYCGDLGPKRREGDRQIPEGFYHINLFNPASKFHLSMQINYPNKSDLIRTTDLKHPGGLIFIHGNRVTIGCIPLGNHAIEELYIICVDSKSSEQKNIPVHIFPCRFMDEKNAELLKAYITDKPSLKPFWDELISGYEYFENTNLLPDMKIADDGCYYLQAFVD